MRQGFKRFFLWNCSLSWGNDAKRWFSMVKGGFPGNAEMLREDPALSLLPYNCCPIKGGDNDLNPRIFKSLLSVKVPVCCLAGRTESACPLHL